jgi:hypothetical protein
MSLDPSARTLGSHNQEAANLSKCGGKRVDVPPNWKEKSGMPTDWRGWPTEESTK